MATDPEGKKLYTASSDGFIRFWDIKTGKATLSFEAHKGAILSVFVNHRGQLNPAPSGWQGMGRGLECWLIVLAENVLAGADVRLGPSDLNYCDFVTVLNFVAVKKFADIRFLLWTIDFMHVVFVSNFLNDSSSS